MGEFTARVGEVGEVATGGELVEFKATGGELVEFTATGGEFASRGVSFAFAAVGAGGADGGGAWLHRGDGPDPELGRARTGDANPDAQGAHRGVCAHLHQARVRVGQRHHGGAAPFGIVL
eukprot:789719-Prorocentrum_minimum.AAC.1